MTKLMSPVKTTISLDRYEGTVHDDGKQLLRMRERQAVDA